MIWNIRGHVFIRAEESRGESASRASLSIEDSIPFYIQLHHFWLSLSHYPHIHSISDSITRINKTKSKWIHEFHPVKECSIITSSPAVNLFKSSAYSVFYSSHFPIFQLKFFFHFFSMLCHISMSRFWENQLNWRSYFDSQMKGIFFYLLLYYFHRLPYDLVSINSILYYFSSPIRSEKSQQWKEFYLYAEDR